MQRARDARVDHLITGLIAAGLLDGATTVRALPALRQQIFTQVFFWLPAAIVAAPHRDPAERLDGHARSVLALFLGYCTPAGRRQLDALLGPITGHASDGRRRAPRRRAARRARRRG